MNERNEFQGHFTVPGERWYLIGNGMERSGKIMRVLGSIKLAVESTIENKRLNGINEFLV